jgi:hypothetical protein
MDLQGKAEGAVPSAAQLDAKLELLPKKQRIEEMKTEVRHSGT